MNLEDSDMPLLVKALDHYAAYLRVMNRDSRAYSQLLERLQRKGPGREEQVVEAPAVKKRGKR